MEAEALFTKYPITINPLYSHPGLGLHVATIYRDGPGADWKDNPEVYILEQFIVDSRTKLRIELAKGGGAAVSIFPATEADTKKMKHFKNAF